MDKKSGGPSVVPCGAHELTGISSKAVFFQALFPQLLFL